MSINGIPSHSMDTILMLLDYMYEYQKPRNINDLCITNAQTLYDLINTGNLVPPDKIQIKAVMVAGINETNDLVFVPNHMAIKLGDKIIDPSYNTYLLKDSIYTDNIATIFTKYGVERFKKYDMKTYLKLFIQLKEFETKMNNNEFVITDKTYYNDQINYLISVGAILSF